MPAPAASPAHGVVLECHARCQAIDRDARTLVLEDGRRLAYGTLVIATGSLVRELPHLPVGMPHVHYLRTEADAQRLTMKLRETRRLLVVGAGLIGLEVAASAAELGVPTTVLELAPRILARVCDEEIGGLVEAEHRRRGVGSAARMRGGFGGGCRRRVGGDYHHGRARRGGPDRRRHGREAERSARRFCGARGRRRDRGRRVLPDVRSAIFAAGDVVRFPGPHGPVRLENWRHAQDQGVVAGRNAAGGSEPYLTIPSFWSEQYDLYIQGVGWPVPGSTRVRRPLPGNAALIFDVSDGRLVGAQGINVQRDLAAVRRLIERRTPVDPAALADPSQPLAAMLKRGEPSGVLGF